MLRAIRSDFPAPTVHAQEPVSTSSAAMWDAWAAYDPVAIGVFVDEELTRRRRDRRPRRGNELRGVSSPRGALPPSPEAEQSVTGLDDLMVELCYDRDFTTVDGTAPPRSETASPR